MRPGQFQYAVISHLKLYFEKELELHPRSRPFTDIPKAQKNIIRIVQGYLDSVEDSYCDSERPNWKVKADQKKTSPFQISFDAAYSFYINSDGQIGVHIGDNLAITALYVNVLKYVFYLLCCH